MANNSTDDDRAEQLASLLVEKLRRRRGDEIDPRRTRDRWSRPGEAGSERAATLTLMLRLDEDDPTVAGGWLVLPFRLDYDGFLGRNIVYLDEYLDSALAMRYVSDRRTARLKVEGLSEFQPRPLSPAEIAQTWPEQPPRRRLLGRETMRRHG